MNPAQVDWGSLQSGIEGEVWLPGESGYDGARRLVLKQFDHVRPQAVVRCRRAEDVAEAVAFARAHGIPCAIRSGGHSFAGYSTGTGMVIDVSGLDRVEVGGDVVRAQAGVQLVDLYDATLRHDLAVPSGWCPTVALGGLALGGGIGLETRKHGLTVDHMLSATLVLADGRTVTCDEQHHPDLYWAVRGGGGGNFGVAVEFTFRPVPVGDLLDYRLTWPWVDATAVVDAWQRWAPDAPDDLASVINIGVTDAGDGSEPELAVAGVWHGDPAEGERLLRDLADLAGREPSSWSSAVRTYRATIMNWFDCGGFTPAEAHLVGHNPAAQIERYAFSLCRGGFFDTVVPTEGLKELLAAVTGRPFAGQRRDLNFIALGGAANRVAPDATAFVHRGSRYYTGYSADMDPVVPAHGPEAARAWIDGAFETLGPWWSGRSYQNFIDSRLADWQQAYYGENLARLQRVKEQYDAARFFDFPQAI
ncbi:FAD-binding oxidoreductase [Streptomyces albidoflavus]|uniref:FAD-binding oxidoreductase n=1 Tax=Streptomyces koyangensis TaxID=188770 RepID=UPI003D031B36|nr:FAD-binding oxidoreductase [Streptomyces albidoflavus]